MAEAERGAEEARAEGTTGGSGGSEEGSEGEDMVESAGEEAMAGLVHRMTRLGPAKSRISRLTLNFSHFPGSVPTAQ